MRLRPLAITGGAITMPVFLPLMAVFASAGRPDLVRGLLLGLAVGLLNNLLLARKLDRVIDGRDPWQNLNAAMPRNMMLRFALILTVCIAAARTPGISVAALAGGLGLSLVAHIVYVSWTVRKQWMKEDGVPVYG